ncbi:hypothetical protein FFF34_006960 [Inquilinus sp. KBS0705]|nr:hypothetical protein FFF34_006960 [Inquilinus sp. KBS0705]
MKQPLLLSLLLLLISTTAFSQPASGQKYLGGSLYFNYDQAGKYSVTYYSTGYTQYNNSNVVNFNISPEFGFFLNDSWSIGIRPSYTRVSGTERSNFYSTTPGIESYSSTTDYKAEDIGLAIEFRYYWMLTNKFGIYPQFGIGTSNNIKDFSAGLLSVGGGPNVVFFPTESLGINMGFGNINYSYGYQTKGSFFNVGLNNNINFGINYYF